MTSAVTSRGSVVAGLGAYRPRRAVTNAELGRSLDTSDNWIRSRVGICERRIASSDEDPVTMGIAAGRNALEASGVDHGEIGVVLVATCTMETAIPQAAAQVARGLGLEVGAFDINSGCAGFTSALAVASALVRERSADHVLVIGTERMSDWVDWSDRAVSVLMGDAAAGAVVSKAEHRGIGPAVWGSLGVGAEVLGIPTREGRLQMDGRAVYRWGSSLAPRIDEVLKVRQVGPADVAALIPHQANERIIDALAGKLGWPDSVFVSRDVQTSGNTAAASVPLALARALNNGQVAPGDLAVLFGFGAGLAYSGQVIEVPQSVVITHD